VLCTVWIALTIVIFTSGRGGTNPTPFVAKPPSIRDTGLIALLCVVVLASVAMLQVWIDPGRTRRVLDHRRARTAERAAAPLRSGTLTVGDLSHDLRLVRHTWRERVRSLPLQSVLGGIYATQPAIPLGFALSAVGAALTMMLVPQVLASPAPVARAGPSGHSSLRSSPSRS